MKSMIATILLAFSLVATIGSSAQAEGGLLVRVDDQPKSFDPPPFVENGRALVPFRQLFEVLGASVNWDSATSTASAERGPMRLELKTGALVALVNGKSVPLDVPVMNVNGRLFVPLRFAAETLGADVRYDDATRVIDVTSTPVEVMAEAIPLQKGLTAAFRYRMDSTQTNQYLHISVSDVAASGAVSYTYDGDPQGSPNAGNRLTSGLTDSLSFNHKFVNGAQYTGNDTAPWASRLVVESLRAFGRVEGFRVGGSGGTGLTARALVLQEKGTYSVIVNGRLSTVPVLKAKDADGFYYLVILDSPTNPLVLEVTPLISGQATGWRVAEISQPAE